MSESNFFLRIRFYTLESYHNYKNPVGRIDSLKKNNQGQEALTELGKDWDLPPEVADKLEELTCLLYSNNTVTTKVNELGYQLYVHEEERENANSFLLAEIVL